MSKPLEYKLEIYNSESKNECIYSFSSKTVFPPFSEGDCVYIWAASASEPMQDYTSTSDQNLITDISHDASGSLVYSTTTLPAGQVAGKNYVLSTGVNSTCQCNTLPQFDYWSCIPQYFSWSLI